MDEIQIGVGSMHYAELICSGNELLIRAACEGVNGRLQSKQLR